MTTNALAAQRNAEEKRSNKAKERETRRSNVAKEWETNRHNRVTEGENVAERQRKSTRDVMDTTIGAVNAAGNIVKAVGAVGANHPEWYASSPALLAQTGTFPWRYNYGTAYQNTVGLEAVGVACILAFEPYIPADGTATDPINVAAQKLFSRMRAHNAGSNVGEPSDYMQLILAITDIYAFRQEITRAYGLIKRYSPVNAAYPRAILGALGYDADDLIAHQVDLLSYINELGRKLHSFTLPIGYRFFERRIWLSSNVFSESETDVERSQLYIPAQQSFYKYESNEDNNFVPTLVAQRFRGPATAANTVQDIRAFGDALINALYYMEDLGIISGNIEKAFGGNLYRALEVPTSYETPIKYDQKALEMIQNAIPIGQVNNNTITQVDGATWLLRSTGSTPSPLDRLRLTAVTAGSTINTIAGRFGGAGKAYFDIWLTTHESNPDPAYVASISSMIPTATAFTVDGGVSAGALTEVATYMSLIYPKLDDDGRTIYVKRSIDGYIFTSGSYIPDSLPDEGALEAYFQDVQTSDVISALSLFDYAPRVQMLGLNLRASGGSPEVGVVDNKLLWDVDNFTLIPRASLERFHKALRFSLFDSDILDKAMSGMSR